MKFLIKKAIEKKRRRSKKITQLSIVLFLILRLDGARIRHYKIFILDCFFFILFVILMPPRHPDEIRHEKRREFYSDVMQSITSAGNEVVFLFTCMISFRKCHMEGEHNDT